MKNLQDKSSGMLEISGFSDQGNWLKSIEEYYWQVQSRCSQDQT